jgi:branched-chain amino acid transport system substrate-binding protein
MAKKVALLIGVSEYQSGFTPLPASIGDVEAMQRVLKNPEIGDFDDVKILKNPTSQQMSEEIEELFANRRTDDLVLLFFSGHGGNLGNNKLYFATSNTRKNSNKNTEVVISTAVTASFVNQIMSNSVSRHQVLILDCCYSGAFSNDLYAKSDGSDLIRNQLGGEGRVIITSSDFREYSYEQEGGNISVFTRYIVEGLEDGVADRDDDGLISVGELYDYAKEKVRESGLDMSPRIYPVKEGSKIILAKSSAGDPQKIYHQEVGFLVRSGNGKISDTGRDLLNELRNEYLINIEEASAIEEKVLKPYRDLQEKSERYESRFRREIQQKYPIIDQTREELKRLQKILQLTDGKIALIENRVIEERQQQLQEYELAFRQAIEEYYPVQYQDSGLTALQQRLQLSDEDIRAIESPIIADKNNKLEEYENKFIDKIKQKYPLGKAARQELQELRNSLRLKDDEVQSIKQRVIQKIKKEKILSRELKVGRILIVSAQKIGEKNHPGSHD